MRAKYRQVALNYDRRPARPGDTVAAIEHTVTGTVEGVAFGASLLDHRSITDPGYENAIRQDLFRLLGHEIAQKLQEEAHLDY